MVTNSTKNKLTQTLAAGAASFGVLAGVGLVGSGAASAATMTISGGSFSNPQQTTEIMQMGTLSKFNSSLGTLTGVKLTLTGAATQSFTGTNNASGSVTANITSTTDLIYSFTGITLGPLTPFPSLSSSSGALSYATGETKSFGPFTPSNSVDYLFPPNASLAAFLGAAGDTFKVNCESLSSLTVAGGGGNISTTQTTTAGCGASVEYTFEHTPPMEVPEPSAVLGLGLLGLGAFFKRNKQQDSDKA